MKILFADDHWIVRASLRHVFEHLDIDFEAIEASSYLEALELLKDESNVGLIVIDLIMPGFDDFEGLENLRKKYPGIPTIVLSVHDDRNSVLRCIEHGVVGYVPKSTDAKELTHAIEQVLAGDVYFPRQVLSGRYEPLSSSATNDTPRPQAPKDVTPDHQILTSREKEVMSWLGRGLSDIKIAEKLQLSPNTVRVHIKNTMKKLGLSDRAETMHFAVTNIQEMLSDTAT